MHNKISFLKSAPGMILTAIFCNFLWGSAFPCIKIGYHLFQVSANDSASQILFAGTRFTLAGILVILIGSFLSGKKLLPTKNNFPKVLILALFQTILQYLFFYIGLAHTSGVKSSIIEATSVFMAILISSFFFRMERFTSKKILGCLLGFAGVVLVNLGGHAVSMGFQWNGEGFILLSTISCACSTVLIKFFSRTENPVLLSGWQFFIGGLVMALYGFLTGGRLTVTSGAAWLLLLYLALISSVAYSLWGILLKYHPVSKVSVYGFTNPVFGVLLSAVFLHENALGWQIFAALPLVCIGIWCVNSAGAGNAAQAAKSETSGAK